MSSDFVFLIFCGILRFLFGHFLKRKLFCAGPSRPGVKAWEPGACRARAAVQGDGLVSDGRRESAANRK